MRKCVFLAVTHRDVEHRFPCPGRAHIRRAPRKIVVVDDNLYADEAMKTLLQLHSHAVTLASNADQALRDARLEMPDVFLVDIGLPGKSGHKLTTELGQLPCKKPLRIIAMTGFGQPEGSATIPGRGV